MVNKLGHLIFLLVVLMTAGCNGALWGNLAVLAVSVGIFLGTLSLGRQSPPRAPTESRQDKLASLQKGGQTPGQP